MRKKIIGIFVFSFFLFSIFISVAEASCLNPSWTQTVCSSGKIPGVIDDCANITPPWGQGTPNDKCCCDKPVDPSCYWQAESETTAGGQAHWVYCNNQTVLQTGSQISRCANIPKPDPNIYYGCCCSSVLTPQKQQTESKPPLFEAPKLQIGLPTLSLTERVQCTASGDNWECKIPWIGEYVKAIYNYGLGIAGILAAIVLMAGGVVWLVSAGDASRVSLAKELISGSVTGLVILMTSYVLLVQINPELVNFKPIKIGAIKPSDITPSPENTSQFSTKCKSTTTGACAISNMSAFGAKAEEASAICMAESGGNAGIYNSLTKCTGGEYAVWGLFQFNLSANKFTDENNVVLNCPKAYNKTWTNSSPSCTIVDEPLYNACVKAATNPNLSIMNAQKLVAASKGWGPWEANSKWCNF